MLGIWLKKTFVGIKIGKYPIKLTTHHSQSSPPIVSSLWKAPYLTHFWRRNAAIKQYSVFRPNSTDNLHMLDATVCSSSLWSGPKESISGYECESPWLSFNLRVLRKLRLCPSCVSTWNTETYSTAHDLSECSVQSSFPSSRIDNQPMWLPLNCMRQKVKKQHTTLHTEKTCFLHSAGRCSSAHQAPTERGASWKGSWALAWPGYE